MKAPVEMVALDGVRQAFYVEDELIELQPIGVGVVGYGQLGGSG